MAVTALVTLDLPLADASQFVFISAALVYIITMHFAAKHEGLPIGYLTRPIEFADPVTLVDPLLYRTGPHPWGSRSRSDKILGWRVWFLIILSVALCLLCNLMGPATAVLVIPSLQWLTTAKVGNRMFMSLNSAQPPQINWDSWFWLWSQCWEEDTLNQRFACAYSPFGLQLDQWYVNAIATSGVAMSSQSSANNFPLTFAANSSAEVIGTNAYDYNVSRYPPPSEWQTKSLI